MPDDDVSTIAALGHRFSGLAATLSSADQSAIDPDKVVRLATRTLPRADACGLTLIKLNHRPQSLGSSGPVADEVDAIQFTLGEGPCLSAAQSDVVEVADDLATDGRWPRFGPRCVEATGVRSILSVRLPLAAGDHAALNFHSRQTHAFGEVDIALASMFAPFAAVAVEHAMRAEDADNFRAALSSSRQIGTAMGILMARGGLTADEAFQQLRAASQHLNRKLRDIAVEVEETGELPVLTRKSGRAAK